MKFQIVPRLWLLTSSGSKKKKAKYVCLSVAKASHSYKTWAEFFSSASRFLHKRLSITPIMYKCVLRVSCSVRRPVKTQDCILLKESSLVLAVGPGLEIRFWACLSIPFRPCSTAICWLSIQPLLFLLTFFKETTKVGSGPINWWTLPSLASPSIISFPRTPECPGTQKSTTEC